MESVAAFIPLDRRRALTGGYALPDRVRGAALFADISGFTPLTAALAEELGPQFGAEALIGELNRVYTALIAEVHRYQGVVINFSGDAITCWFDEKVRETGNAALRATTCGLALQEVMAGLGSVRTPRGSVFPLALKVAIAAGPARRFLVGNPEAYVVEAMAGSTLDRMAAAEKQAGRGEVVVTAEVLAELGAPRVAAWRVKEGERFAVIDGLAQRVDPSPDEEEPAPAPETARPWLLPPVYARLQQFADAFLAELRPSVSLFIKFSGIDYDGDDKAGEKLDYFVRRVQAVLSRYEAFLLQVTMGDKGSYLYASFGAPIAHEDDAARAATAALALRDVPEVFTFLEPLQMGISQGPVHSGAYGSPRRRTFGVMGSDVNIAARLMTTAMPGQILVSARMAHVLEERFELEALPPVSLKGIEGPSELWALKGRRIVTRGAALRQTGQPMVGREAELARVETALAALARGEQANLLIEGAAGIGKSRLVEELVQRVDGDTLILTGTGDAIEQSTPYHAWRPVFEQVFGIEAFEQGAQADGALQEHVTASLDASVCHLAPLLNVVLPLDLPQTELTEQMTGEARQDNTQLLLVTILQHAAADRRLLLIFEDAHWLDSASWALLRRVQREVAPHLLVVVTRLLGEDAPTVYTDLRALPATEHLLLETLPRAAIETLVCQRLGVATLPAPVLKLIHEKAEGHPFFSEELAYALRDGGVLEIANGEARLASNAANLEALDFPDTIQGVITSRIDLLPPQQQLTVKVASVIGRIFAYRLLRDVYPVQREAGVLHESLEHLARLDITPQETPEPNLAYIFKHIVTQEVVYSLMTFAQREQLHRNTALWYEQADEGERYYALLAHHWQLAGEREKASQYYAKAGENAFRDFANQEAMRFFGEALALGPNRPAVERAAWQRLIGEAAYRLTLMEQSQTHYEEALAALGRSGPRSAARTAVGLAGQLIRQVGHRVRRNGGSGTARGDERAALLEASRIYEGVSEVYYNAGDFLRSFYCVMSAFNLAEEVGPTPELMRGYANMCATLSAMSLNRPAESYRQRTLALAEQVDDLSAKAWIQIPLSIYSLWIGAWDRGEEEVGEALAIYERLGDWRRWGVAAWVWPQLVQSKGELRRAQALWAELHSVAQRSDDTRHQVRSRGGQFFNHLALGQTEAAFGCLEAAGAVLEENPEMMPIEERLWYGIKATRALEEGAWTEARALAREQMAAIGRARFKFDLLEVFAAPAEVMLALWERGEATAKEAQEGCKVVNAYARTYAFARPRALRCSGRKAWLDGKQGRAQKLWQKSLAQADALAMPYERTLTLREMGRSLGDSEALAAADTLLAALYVEND